MELGLLGILLLVIVLPLLILHLRRRLGLDGLEGWTDRTDA
jgi:hypothetical protein